MAIDPVNSADPYYVDPEVKIRQRSQEEDTVRQNAEDKKEIEDQQEYTEQREQEIEKGESTEIDLFA